MAVKIADVRRFALSLPEATEEPHFHMSSFRVRGKIFATVPPAEKKLWWGKRIAGLRVTLAAAKLADIKYLLQSAWQRKAPKALRDKVGGADDR